MTELRRSLGLPLLVLYGLGVTIGAGIYVLLGAAAARAGVHAPMAFVIAAAVMGFSAASFAELSARLPVSAGEAAYVHVGFGSKKLSALVGFLVIASGVVSSAAISAGSTGYIREFVDLPPGLLIVIIVLGLGLIAAWGITQSVMFAGAFTLFEAGALVAVIGAGLWTDPGLVRALPDVVPMTGEPAAWIGIAGAGLLAFFAFIGFEDMVNLAEEVKAPERTLPRAIFITLVLGTLLYFGVTAVAVLAVPVDELAASEAPLSFVFERITGASPALITMIAIVATLNGVIIQIVMASRVLYGLGRQGSVPQVLARVDPRTQTPLIATGLVTVSVLALALTVPLENLAEWTSRIVLVVFTLVNASLVLIKRRGTPAPEGAFTVRVWVPVVGALTCAALLASGFLG
ncbi:MAG: amino acid permease [Rhodospirillales bacterium]|nr:amino acid permease [Rhodospirillales bacterium]MBO6785265.1 amino acid permease [Rhodospirillales bacterium]